MTIPFPASSIVQRTQADLAAGARLGRLEVWAIGRVVRGEMFAFHRLSSRTAVMADGRWHYADSLDLEPAVTPPSGYWSWDEALLHEDLATPRMALISGKPHRDHLYVRGLAQDGWTLARALRMLLERQRAAWNFAPIAFERFTTLFG